MPIFSKIDANLKEISEIPFSLEADIQKLVEKNLQTIFNLQLIKSEFALRSLRIDTLAFDRESNSFVIIEYKRDKSFSVVDQGFAYLALLLNNKAEFILEYNENSKESLRKDDVEWSESKVIFIARSYTDYQKEAIGFKDLPIELWEIKNYSNKTILFNQIQSPEKTESIKTISSKSEVFRSVSREIKTYTEEYHFEKHSSVKTKELYEEIHDRILSLGNNIDVVIRKKYIAFKSNYNFVYINLKRSMIHVDLSLKINEINDPNNVIRNMESTGHYGGGKTRMTITEKSDIPYLMDLIKQSYAKSIKS